MYLLLVNISELNTKGCVMRDHVISILYLNYFFLVKNFELQCMK
jgi:hypothetical protein